MHNRPVTFITGTRKGIGKFLVERFLKQGHTVIGCSRKEPDWKIEGYFHFQADVANESQIKAIFSSVSKDFGRLDYLINNAGIASMNHFLLTPVSTVNDLIQTNLVGTFVVSREAARLMKKQKSGRIVNFSTVAVPLKLEGEAVYAASKAGVVKLTEILARELASFGITVNAVGPTPIETDLIRNVPKEKIDQLLERQSIRRLGIMEDVANVIDFFFKPESGFVTGQTIYLGGV